MIVNRKSLRWTFDHASAASDAISDLIRHATNPTQCNPINSIKRRVFDTNSRIKLNDLEIQPLISDRLFTPRSIPLNDRAKDRRHIEPVLRCRVQIQFDGVVFNDFMHTIAAANDTASAETTFPAALFDVLLNLFFGLLSLGILFHLVQERRKVILVKNVRDAIPPVGRHRAYSATATE